MNAIIYANHMQLQQVFMFTHQYSFLHYNRVCIPQHMYKSSGHLVENKLRTHVRSYMYFLEQQTQIGLS